MKKHNDEGPGYLHDVKSDNFNEVKSEIFIIAFDLPSKKAGLGIPLVKCDTSNPSKVDERCSKF